MGGSSSKQEVTGKNLKNYMKDEKIQLEAEYKGVDPALLAYQQQKKDVGKEQEALKQLSRDEKKYALAQQEAALQERIDKAREDMEQAQRTREQMGFEKETRKIEATPLVTQVKKPETVNQSNRVVGQELSVAPSLPAKIISQQIGGEAVNGTRNDQQIGRLNETQNTSASFISQKAPSVANANVPEQDHAEERKMQELRRLRAAAKVAAEQAKQQPAKENIPSVVAPIKQQAMRVDMRAPLVGQKQKIDKDSEQEDDEDGIDLRRSMPGQAKIDLAKAQIATVSYNQSSSPRNFYVPDLGTNSFNRAKGGNSLMKNQNIIMLGQHDVDTQDGEAMRNRNINISDLQSLFV